MIFKNMKPFNVDEKTSSTKQMGGIITKVESQQLMSTLVASTTSLNKS